MLPILLKEYATVHISDALNLYLEGNHFEPRLGFHSFSQSK
jgi:hypothetical protein